MLRRPSRCADNKKEVIPTRVQKGNLGGLVQFLVGIEPQPLIACERTCQFHAWLSLNLPATDP